jgi:hypothetical protein
MTFACGPLARIPSVPAIVPASLAADDSNAILARVIAPTVYAQRDETFTLERVVAIVHPTRRIIAYHLLWRDDAYGAWLPFTKATDAEIVWVGYDATNAPTDVWTYWHGTILHTDWTEKGAPAVNVQWGKHGSMPRGTRLEDLPRNKSLRAFHILSVLGSPDLWLGNLSRPGPWCFCHGYARYGEFTRPIALGMRLDAIARTSRPAPTLRAVFGDGYTNKRPWPDDRGMGAVPPR